MKRIHYAGGSLLTGDDIADVLVRLAEALALNTRAAEIKAPAVTDHGTVTDVTLLVGPASQMLTEHVEFDGEELEDAAFVEEMESRVRELAPRRAGFVQNGTEGLDDVEIDLL